MTVVRRDIAPPSRAERGNWQHPQLWRLRQHESDHTAQPTGRAFREPPTTSPTPSPSFRPS